MTADNYLYTILQREAVDLGPLSPVLSVIEMLIPMIQRWAGNALMGVSPSGSFSKGTPNRSGTDIDLFISLSPQTVATLSEIYEGLFAYLVAQDLAPKRQNVSINIRVASAYDVDLVPAKQQDLWSQDHSLWRNRAKTWTKTNVQTHIAHVRAGGRQAETRVLKLWRDQAGLDFPSFYLELLTIRGLANVNGSLSANVWQMFQFLAENIESARVVDPANTNNIISDDLTAAEKRRIHDAARRAMQAKNWGEIVQ